MARLKDPLLWLYSLTAAVIGSAANTIVVVVVDPEKFNLTTGWKNLLLVMGVSGIIAAGNYLKQHPLPEIDQ